MKARLLDPSSPDWTAALTRAYHDFFHLPSYAALQAAWIQGEAVALHVRDGQAELLLPLIVRPIGEGSYDATSPYGYSGPVVSAAADADFIGGALAAGMALLAAEGLVSLFVRCHPLIDTPVPGTLGKLVEHGDTVVVDLGLEEAELWRQTRRDHRNQISRALRLGHRVVFDTDRQHERAFERLYLDTMSRLDARSEYRYDSGYFEGLRSALGDRLRLVVVEIDGVVAAGALFVTTCGIVQYHLSGSDERYRKDRPTKLLIHAARGWAREQGHRWLHLGGGLGAANDSLLEFKAGFSELRRPFRTFRAILRPDAYRSLLGARSGSAIDDETGYFPAYRAPGAEPDARTSSVLRPSQPADAPPRASRTD
jgi:hypothetical protein